MLDTLQALGLLTAMEMVGPLVLGLLLAYGILRSRRTRASRRAADQATVENYREEERVRRAQSEV